MGNRLGLGRIYTEKDIEEARASPSFEREFNLKFLGVIGNVFRTDSIEQAIERGKLYNPPMTTNDVNYATQKSMGIDPGFGGSSFGIVLCQREDRYIQVIEATEYQRPDFNDMLQVVSRLLRKYGRSVGKIHIDASNPSFIRTLKLQLGENEAYEDEMKDYKKKGLDYEHYNTVIPVNFGTTHKEMLINCKLLMERNYVAINPKFDKLITSLRTAVENDGKLDKEVTSYNNIFDAFRLSLNNWYFKSNEEDYRTTANIITKQY
jgi:hypothetical protein